MEPGATLPHAVLALLDAVDAETLLRDAEGLAEGLADAGWTPEVESEHFRVDGWDVVSSDRAPGLSVFADGDQRDVRGAALAVAAALAARSGEWTFCTEGPDWSAWSVEDPRWQSLDID
ncbi:hypothetical protein ACIPVB_11690 [Microbacterium sp. NPDC090007]|uniref:hypothetical protein n=1 Tax=Microbacterium sp. NPDC090007 TaxID=3364204 RepID=UPI0037F5C179